MRAGHGATAKVLRMPKQTLGHWVRPSERGRFRGAVDKPVSAEQMELARLRAELARVKMDPDIVKLPSWPGPVSSHSRRR